MTESISATSPALVAALFMLVVSAQAQEWQDVRCIPADLPTEAMFEVVRVVEGFEGTQLEWQTLQGDQNAPNSLALDTAEKHSGQAALRVDYGFRGNLFYDYLQFTRPLEIPEPGLGIGFWLKTDGTAFPIRLRITDASGETHQMDMVGDAAGGWQFYAVALDAPGNAWGGDGNWRCDYPLQLSGLCVDRPHVGFSGKGSLWVDDVSLVKHRVVPDTLHVQTADKRFGNVHEPGSSVALRLSGDGDRVRWLLTDHTEAEVARGEGPATGTEARFLLPTAGYYQCRIELTGPEGVRETQNFHAAAVAPQRDTPMSDAIGLNCHFGQNAYPMECMELLQRYGIDRFRDEMGWVYVERERGVYALPEHLQRYLDHARELRMRPLVILDYHNDLYDGGNFPNSPEAIAGFAEYGANVARLTRGVVSDFEVWNEWIGGCGMGARTGDHGPEAYGKLLAPTYRALKREVPDAKVVGIGGEYGAACAENVATMVASAGPNSMDAWSIHPYRYPRTPEESDLMGEVSRIATSATQHGAPMSAWITEIGYPTHRGQGASGYMDQARHCIRTLLLLHSTPGVERVYWYDLKDDGLVREYDQHGFGVVHHEAYNCAPKPAMVAMSAFARLTARGRQVSLTHTGETWCATYAGADGTSLVAAWVTGEARKVQVAGRDLQVLDLMGRPLATDGTVTLSTSPVYIAGNGAISLAN